VQPKVLLAGDPQKIDLAFPQSVKAKAMARVEILPGHCSSDWRQGAPAVLSSADYILGTWGMPMLDEQFLEAAPNLRGVFYAAGSVKGFATEASYARGITISSAWAANGIPVAEYTLATILLSLKQFWAHSRQSRERQKTLNISGGYGSTVGIVSLGAIGRYLVDLLKKFDLRVIAYDPYLSKEDAALMGVESVSLETVFEQSDVVSLHTPWLPETEGMIHAGLISRMKQGATLINTSRGAIVNETDLCMVLQSRVDLTAILDVTYPEPPLKDSPLYDCPNIIITPHIAGSMGGEVARMGNWMVDELFRAINGRPLQHAVSLEMLAKMA